MSVKIIHPYIISAFHPLVNSLLNKTYGRLPGKDLLGHIASIIMCKYLFVSTLFNGGGGWGGFDISQSSKRPPHMLLLHFIYYYFLRKVQYFSVNVEYLARELLVPCL